MSLLFLSTALALTCAESSHTYANAPTENLGALRIRQGWACSAEGLACLYRSDVPSHVVERLRPQEGTPFEVQGTGSPSTVVLDMGCGTLSVTGSGTVHASGCHNGSSPSLDQTDATAILRGHPGNGVCADVSAHVPKNARLLVFHRGQHVAVTGMEGPVEIHAARAAISVVGPSKLVEVETLNGQVYVDASGVRAGRRWPRHRRGRCGGWGHRAHHHGERLPVRLGRPDAPHGRELGGRAHPHPSHPAA